jgi:hypothetical protein
MPRVEFCDKCEKRIDETTDEYVVISNTFDTKPRVIVHVECAEGAGFQPIDR